MRIDKFIWSVRLTKTRTLATKECNSEKIKLNNKFIKPSAEVAIGDSLEVKRNPVWLKYLILEIPSSRVGAKLVPNCIKDCSLEKDINLLKELEQINKQNKLLGIKGRPTKKVRRDLDSLKE